MSEESSNQSNQQQQQNEELLKDGKNAHNAYCKNKNCNSMVFRSNTAPMTQKEGVSLPNNSDAEEINVSDHFWSFDDIFQFENITFTKEATTKNGKIKYLACCDCELGPIGYQDLESKICYVDVNKVRYEK